MTRRSFLTCSAAVAVTVAGIALLSPEALLASKGVAPSRELLVWTREVGVLILGAGVTTWLVRKAPDSETLRGVLIGNALLHLGLLPIELVAFARGVLTQLGGVAPNSLLHVLLATGFVVYARRIQTG